MEWEEKLEAWRQRYRDHIEQVSRFKALLKGEVPEGESVRVEGNGEYGAYVTIHNALNALTPRQKYLNKLTFYLNAENGTIRLNKRKATTDPKYLVDSGFSEQVEAIILKAWEDSNDANI